MICLPYLEMLPNSLIYSLTTGVTIEDIQMVKVSLFASFQYSLLAFSTRESEGLDQNDTEMRNRDHLFFRTFGRAIAVFNPQNRLYSRRAAQGQNT